MSIKEFAGVWFTPSIRKKISLLSSVVLTVSIGLFVKSTDNVQQSSLLSTGINTCFQRLTQTYTSLVISSQTSPYVQEAFTSLTGECFAELASKFQTSYLQADEELEKFINNLGSDAHWFNKRAQSIKSVTVDEEQDEFSLEDNTPKQDDLAIGKFEKLEALKDKTLDVIEYNLVRMSQYANYLSSLILTSALLTLFSFGFYLRSLRYSSGEARVLAGEIETLNAKKEFHDAQKIEKLMVGILRKANLGSVADFFLNYHESLLLKTANGEISTDATPAAQNLWADDDAVVTTDLQVPVAQVESINLNSAFAEVIALLSKKAFTHGVIIDFDVDENLNVVGKEEALMQILYTAIDNAINNSLSHNRGRKISIRSKPLGSTIYLKILVIGHCFNTGSLEYVSNGGANTDSPDVEVSLKLCQALIKDVNGKIVLRNIFDEMGSLTGSSTELLFDRSASGKHVAEAETRTESPSHDEAKPRLVSVVKGSKRELRKELLNN
ncbi:MAG: HAMP domain-containing histidine kinase [Bacteriovoracaceae bacterium]|nr:HAMP domain-containing histidine kinase [Bacteriovoracaceae bacterium]